MDRRKVRAAGETFEGFRGGGAGRSEQAGLDSTSSTQSCEGDLTRPAPYGGRRIFIQTLRAFRLAELGRLEAWRLGGLEVWRFGALDKGGGKLPRKRRTNRSHYGVLARLELEHRTHYGEITRFYT